MAVILRVVTLPRPATSIQEDRSAVAVELQDVFIKLVPVLRAANPAALSVALSNTAQALQGRGEKLGQNFELINSYFSQLNQDLPNIQHDISGLADLASNYADAAPDLLGILEALLRDREDVHGQAGPVRAVPRRDRRASPTRPPTSSRRTVRA